MSPESVAKAEQPGAVSAELAVERWSRGALAHATDLVAEEVPVALVYHDVPHVVMLATPADLEDYAVGFTLSEGLVADAQEIRGVEVTYGTASADVHITVAWERFTQLLQRRRNLTGRTGCGLCGTATLEAAIRPVRRVEPRGPRADVQALRDGMRRLAALQPFNDASGAVHAAALLTTDGGFTVREDVGRHNAIDKAVGAVMRAGQVPHSLLVTSRASYEVVHKAAEVGCRLVAAISAPTALALRLAQEAGVTLVGWTRPPRLTVYCGAL